ncbi:MAG: hypothetical protein K0R17_842 [Rariglobus sp.]|jgi:hypothetical protein|nr:hypothetical protein [Rariglobus sp.]
MKKSLLLCLSFLSGWMAAPTALADSATASGTSAEAPGVFAPNSRGYLRHWLVAGPRETPYTGAPGPDHILRRDAPDPRTPTPPATAVPGGPGPSGLTWAFHYPGNNDFIEFSTFYRNLAVVEYYAFTEIVVPEEGDLAARLWAAGTVDLWLNDEPVTRFNVTRYRNPDSRDVTLRVRRGVNRLCVRLQCLGIRDSRILFGLALPEPRGVTVRLPGAGGLAVAARWLDSVRGDGNHGLIAAEPAPAGARVTMPGGGAKEWPEGGRTLAFVEARPVSAEVSVRGTGGAELHRKFEFPGNRAPVRPPEGDRRAAHLAFIAKAGLGQEAPAAWNAVALPLLARRLLGQTTANDARDFAAAIAIIDARQDCADFTLAGLLRLELLGLATPEESAEIERAVLGFRYWNDEPGSDAMCFDSENHTLMFHGCQLLAGLRYAGRTFVNSGRDGDTQARRALSGIRAWLEKIEARGFEEFNSGTYMPITIAAMLNIVDFGGDPELAARMSAQVDRIYRDLARHSFGGGVISPQGRIYRDVLLPEETGTQVFLALATPVTDVQLAGPRPAAGRGGDWAVFPASSPRYRAPADLAALIREPVSMVYRHADVQIVVEKTADTILTSLAVPAVPREGEQPANDLRPGGAGYQQHLWQATLGRDCHVFVNHPGGTFDGTKSRPGYWHGNGMLPRVRQRGGLLQAIHVIADGRWTRPEITPDVWQWGNASTMRPYHVHPVAFTHAYWPADAFDREVRRGGWVFGQKDAGLIGLWCSEKLVPHDDILTGRELRAEGSAAAWLAICGSVEKDGTLEAFMAACEARAPAFDRTAFTMSVKGEPELRWWERPEPMPGQ